MRAFNVMGKRCRASWLALALALALALPVSEVASAGAPGAATTADTALARDLQALLQSEQLAGAVVATVEGGETHVQALGVFHTGTRQPLQATHRVQVGSIAKTVLSLAVLRLVTQGRVDLDAPLGTLLPAVQIDNPWAARSPVRLRHLLDMSSGLPDLQLWHMFNQQHTAQQPLALALRAEHGPLRLRTEPGRQFSYSNLGYTLAGMVVEAVTGERYETWAERELLQPLGMRHSTFEFRRQGADPELAWGHLDQGEPIADWPVAVRPAAHFTTTAADMAQLMRFLLGNGRLGGQAFVRADLMAALGLPSTTANARAGLRTGYGLGVFTRDRHGAVGLCHGGSVAGWRAMFCVYRSTGQGFFFALNQDRETGGHARFEARLVRHVGVAAPQAMLPAAPPATPSAPGDAAWSGLYVPAPGRLPALALADRLLGFWWLDLTPGQPTLREGLGPPRALVPAGLGLYRQADRQQATLALLRGDEGQPVLGGSYLTLRRVPVWQQAALVGTLVLGLLATLVLLPVAAWRVRSLGWRAAAAQWPAAWALLALLLACAGWALQGWQRMAEASPWAWAVALTSTLWPLACALQASQAWRGVPLPGASGRLRDAWAAGLALAALPACAVLVAYGLLPLRPWLL